MAANKDLPPLSNSWPLARRFEARLSEPTGPKGCRLWLGTSTNRGYGLITVDGVRVGAHRAAWHLGSGDDLHGDYVVRHIVCATPACCLFEHLARGTNLDNRHDSIVDGTWSHGERVNTAKLTRDQVIEFRARHTQGETASALGREFGIAQSSASAIVLRKSWAWLDNPV